MKTKKCWIRCAVFIAGAVNTMACSGGLSDFGPESASDPEDVGRIEQALDANLRFGNYCQEDFQSEWRDTLIYSWERCAYFNNQMDDSITKAYYFNMHNAAQFFELPGDHQANNTGADDVDLLWVNTHGGAWTNPMTSTMTMWETNLRAFTSNMRLGDTRLQILATYACDMLKINDNNFWSRLGPTWRGGLKLWVGSHDTVVHSLTTNEVGEDFASYLQDGDSFKTAWHDALEDWNEDNDAAVTAQGRTSAECYSRRDGMNLSNFPGFARLADNNNAVSCWTTWDDL